MKDKYFSSLGCGLFSVYTGIHTSKLSLPSNLWSVTSCFNPAGHSYLCSAAHVPFILNNDVTHLIPVEICHMARCEMLRW